MTIIIENIPMKEDIINSGISVTVASQGERWCKSQLGNYADKKGVYIHHSNGVILYVGITVKRKWGTYGERLRREFKEGANNQVSSKDLHNLLKNQAVQIRCYFLELDVINDMMKCEQYEISKERKALILEQILIELLHPKGNKS